MNPIRKIKKALATGVVSQAQLAARAGLAPSTVSRLLTGKTSTGRASTLRLLEAVVENASGRFVATRTSELLGERQFEGIEQSLNAVDHQQAIERYLARIRAQAGLVDLLGLRLKQRQAIRLAQVYIPLDTVKSDRYASARYPSNAATSTEPLVERLDRGESLYITGDPGCGKSTFCRWLLWHIANGGEDGVRDASGPHATFPRSRLLTLLPILVSLRDVAEVICRTPESASSLGLLELMLGRCAAADGSDLPLELVLSRFNRGEVLLLFDGVDELPEPQRLRLVNAMSGSFRRWIGRGNVVVMTSRPFGLADDEVLRLGLAPAPVQPLTRTQQSALAHRWFGVLSDSPASAQACADALLAQVEQNTWLLPLTSSPLLMTALCVIFDEGKRLPADRFALYDRVVDAVLHNRVANRVELQLVRARLAFVAYGMHTGMGLDERSAPESQVTFNEIERLLRTYQLGTAWSEKQLRTVIETREHLLSQTGLLVPVDDARAAFLHLSFQDFLAGQHMADVDIGNLPALFVGRSSASEWRNSLSFAFGSLLTTSTTPGRAVRLLLELVARCDQAPVGLLLVIADAIEILRGRGVGLPADAEHSVRRAWLRALKSDAAPSIRCEIGEALGWLGDPRFAGDRWSLPDEPLWGMVGVSSGIATKTVEKKGASGQIEETTLSIAVPAFFMARWPVTVAQFRAFADARSGLSLNPKSLAAPPNLPVVHVTWQDATAYCSWLTEVLAESDETPEPLASLLRREEWRESAWEVTLPSQVEWEAAARAWSESVFPWGDQIDPTRANYNDTGVGRRSAVGCFPSGANALGIEELSGNVLEWTRSVEDDDDNEVIDGTATDPRVCVGGAFFSTSENVRCGYAFRTDPDEDSDYLGFRVVVRPRLKRKAPKDNSAPLPPRLEPGLQD